MIEAVGVEIVSGLVAILVALVLAYVKKRKDAKHQLEIAERELDFQQAALSFEDFLHEWSEVHEEIIYLFETTPIDRFVMLRAWNGPVEPRWTTAFFQLRQGKQEPIAYVHFELDQDYVSRIMAIKSRGNIIFQTVAIPDSAIKDVYEMEGVKVSSWHHIDSKDLPNTDCKAVTYCSFSSKETDTIDAATLVKIKLIVSRIKGLSDGTTGPNN